MNARRTHFHRINQLDYGQNHSVPEHRSNTRYLHSFTNTGRTLPTVQPTPYASVVWALLAHIIILDSRVMLLCFIRTADQFRSQWEYRIISLTFSWFSPLSRHSTHYSATTLPSAYFSIPYPLSINHFKASFTSAYNLAYIEKL